MMAKDFSSEKISVRKQGSEEIKYHYRKDIPNKIYLKFIRRPINHLWI